MGAISIDCFISTPSCSMYFTVLDNSLFVAPLEIVLIFNGVNEAKWGLILIERYKTENADKLASCLECVPPLPVGKQCTDRRLQWHPYFFLWIWHHPLFCKFHWLNPEKKMQKNYENLKYICFAHNFTVLINKYPLQKISNVVIHHKHFSFYRRFS